MRTEITALDGDIVSVETAGTEYRAGQAIVYLDATTCPLDREAAVRVIDALTAAIERKDREEAENEAAKLKAGDKVTSSSGRTSRFTVTRDEDAGGLVDLVVLSTGELILNRNATAFRRTHFADGRADAFSPRRVLGGPVTRAPF